MNIKILSMQRVNNYGSFLQAYGLKTFLEELGHTVSFLDIAPGKRSGEYREKGTVKKDHKRTYDVYAIKRLVYKKRAENKNEMLDREREEILGIGKDMDYSTEGCDAVIIGSDEVFNYNPANSWGISFQLFGDIDVPIVASYAASCGYSCIQDVHPKDFKRIGNAFRSMKGISVRDENTLNFVMDISGIQAKFHLDPVLLYPFDKEVPASPVLHNPYMIVYGYKNRFKDKKEIRAIKEYARKNGLKIIALGDSQYWADDFLIPKPFELLSLFQWASCVVTDTFHGAVISAKYHKRFAVFIRPSNENKLEDLLHCLGLNTLKIHNPNELSEVLSSAPDFRKTDAMIHRNRILAKEYFEKVLS